MAMNLGRKIFRQSARRFVAGIGGNSRSSTFLARAPQKACTCHRLLPSHEIDRKKVPLFPGANYASIAMISLCGYLYYTDHKKTIILETPEPSAIVEPLESSAREDRNEAEKKMMEENGVTRELCEAKIAQLKQDIGSLSASPDERIALQIYEGWLRVFTKGERKDQNAGGSNL